MEKLAVLELRQRTLNSLNYIHSFKQLIGVPSGGS